MSRETPTLDGRSTEQIIAELRARLPAYLPGGTLAERGPLAAVARAFAAYLQALAGGINLAPDKARLAFYDMLGIDLLPARPARAPVVFAPLPGAGDGRVEAGTRVGAQPPGGGEPIVFETERAIALAGARLAELVAVLPARDAYADHSADAASGQPCTLFTPLRPIPHELYLAHAVHFALAGSAAVELELELARPAARPLDLVWEHWDGASWCGFKPFRPAAEATQDDSVDGTAGLTRSGTIRLVSSCAASAPGTVGGITSHWVRGRVVSSLPPAPAFEPPQLSHLEVRALIRQPLAAGNCAGLAPDAAFGDRETLDISKRFFPFTQTPQPGGVFYLASAETFSRAGARVTLCMRRGVTPQEEADKLGLQYEWNVNDASDIVEEIRTAARAAKSGLKALTEAQGALAITFPDLFPPGEPEAWYTGTRITVELARTQIVLGLTVSRVLLGPLPPRDAVITLARTISFMANAASMLTAPGAPTNAFVRVNDAAVTLIAKLEAFPPDGPAINAATNNLNTLILGLNPVTDPIFLPDPMPFLANARAQYDALKARITTARAAVEAAIGAIDIVLGKLDRLGPIGAAAAQGKLPPKLPAPTLAWEYWDGSTWRALPNQSASHSVDPQATPATLLNAPGAADLALRFDTPADWMPSDVNGTVGRWLRARLVEGAFGRLRLVSWTDAESGYINFLPIIEPRPPALDALAIGYEHRAPADPPQHCLAYNDFRWQDHSTQARWRGSPFAPFTPSEDRTPTLYAGFDRPLPTDLVSIYLAIVEDEVGTPAPTLEWEHWDGAAWQPLSVEDGTAGLTRPGMLGVLWPGVATPRPTALARAEGLAVQLIDPREAGRFLPGDLVDIAGERGGELAIVASVAGGVLALRAPLGESYTPGTLEPATMPRFGRQRTWLRARLRADAEPPRPTIAGIHLNAAWAAQAQTLDDEILGSSTGEPGQVFFFRRQPVLEGQVVEVRELNGARAEVELPMLLDELAGRGMGRADIRTVPDRRSGRIAEVWVRWHQVAHLLFAGPEDRVYVIDRSGGRLIFGEGARGRVPPAGTNNVLARRYRAGGGVAGNLPAGAIDRLLSGALAQSVTNPHPAEGGAQGELVEQLPSRGAQLTRTRVQALAPADYEALARAASPAVAAARALPLTDAGGRPAAGWVRVVIVPQSRDAQPQPSAELRRQVREYLAARAPAAAAGRISVGVPCYLPIGVVATLAPRDPAQAGPLYAAVLEALGRFLHPLTGGPEGRGWPFGRDVYLSDVAALLEGLPGVDFVASVQLLVENVAMGERATVPPDRLVACGPLRVTLSGSAS